MHENTRRLQATNHKNPLVQSFIVKIGLLQDRLLRNYRKSLQKHE